jgi:predicted nucleic-acid-binding protein
MTDFLDTSVIVRYLTDDPAEMAEQATRLIETEAELHVTETALNETAYVLRRVYGMAREEVVDLLVAFLQRTNITVHAMDKAVVIAALLLCRPSGRVSLGDALIWAAARNVPPSSVYTFDRRFPSEGIELRRP